MCVSACWCGVSTASTRNMMTLMTVSSLAVQRGVCVKLSASCPQQMGRVSLTLHACVYECVCECVQPP